MDKVLIYKNKPKVVDEKKTLMIDVYRPRKTRDVIVNDITLLSVKKWIRQFKNKDSSIKRGLLLSGSSGIGKKLLATLCLEELGFKVRHVGVYDISSKAEFTEYLQNISMNGCRDTAMVISNVDALNSGDPSGFLQVVSDFINPIKGVRKAEEKKRHQETYWTFPIIFTCHKHTFGKVADLAKETEIVFIQKPPKQKVITYFKGVLHQEKIYNVDIEKVVDTCRGDFRQIFSNIVMNKNGKKDTTCMVSKKDRNLDVMETIDLLFKTDAPLDVSTALRLYQIDTSMLPMAAFENYIGLTNDIDVVADMADSMSAGDTVERMVFNTQSWDLVDYVGAFSVVAPALKVRHKTGLVLKFGSMWSRISNMYSKMKTINLVKQRLGFVSIDYMYSVRDYLNRFVRDNDVNTLIEEALHFRLDVETLEMLFKLSSLTGVQKNFRSFYARVKKAWKILDE